MEFEDIIGQTFSDIKVNNNSDEIRFYINGKHYYTMNHHQDCCESVVIEDITGDINDLINTPILIAREDSNSNNPKKNEWGEDESHTWTFYNIGTIKGFVTIRWYGSSDGYYSESVSFDKIKDNEISEE